MEGVALRHRAAPVVNLLSELDTGDTPLLTPEAIPECDIERRSPMKPHIAKACSTRSIAFALLCFGCATTRETPISAVPPIDTPLPYTVAVARFKDVAPRPPGVFDISPAAFQHMMVEELRKMNAFKRVVSLPTTCNHGDSGSIAEACRLGTELGADMVLAGQIEKMEARLQGTNAYAFVGVPLYCSIIGLPLAMAVPDGTHHGAMVVQVWLVEHAGRRLVGSHSILAEAIATTNSFQDGLLTPFAVTKWPGVLPDIQPRTINQFFQQLRQALSAELGHQIARAMDGDKRTALASPVPSRPVERERQPPSDLAMRRSPPHTTYALVVGISQYESGIPRLAYAAKDARDVHRMLLAQGASPDNIKLLTDAEATRANVVRATRSWLSRAKDATVVIHWSGHGFADPNNPSQCYFACYDTPGDAPAVGYKMTALTDDVKDIGARHVVMLLDTCHAGKAAFRGERGLGVVGTGPANDFARLMAEQQKISSGMVIIAAGDADRKSLESSNWQNGALTHIVLRGLSGEADGYLGAGAKDAAVTLGELKAFVQTELPKATTDLGMRACFPVIATLKGDASINSLPLTRVQE